MHETPEEWAAMWIAPAPRDPMRCAVKVEDTTAGDGPIWRQCHRWATVEVAGYPVCQWCGDELLEFGLPEGSDPWPKLLRRRAKEARGQLALWEG